MGKDDLPILRSLHQRQGFAYPLPDMDSPLIECCLVAVDDQDQPMAAVIAERLVQLYLLCPGFSHPAEGIGLIRQMHKETEPLLAAKGYQSAEAFIPPPIERSFGRRLTRSFGWVRNWPSFCFHFKGVG